MTKAELRKLYTEKRATMSEAEYFHLNHLLSEYFFAFVDLSFVRVLHSFVPIEKFREPNTWLIIDRIRREFPHIRLSLPRIQPQTGQLENIFFEGMHQLQANAWGILEPRQGVPTEPEKIDMVLVPLLAFDVYGNRVGYGKGFYDRFLPLCKPSCQRVGLSLFAEPVAIDDINAFDQSLTQIVTPAGVTVF